MGNAGYGNHTKSYVDPERPDPEGGRTISPEKRPGQSDKAWESGTGQESGTGNEHVPPAGPHADPSLTDPDATPGAGTLTPPGEHDDVDSTTG